MTIDTFLAKSGFIEKSELERAKLLAFYLHQVEKQQTVTLKEICDLFYVHGFSLPNTSRLKQNMIKSKSFVKGTEVGTYKLHKKELEVLKKDHPDADSKSEEIVTDETILPEILYKGTRGYIEKLAIQVNASYHRNIFDGCAMLMRRLLEVLLVETYDSLGKRSEIEDNGTLKNLSTIIGHTLANKVVNFHKDSIAVLDTFRELGNLSAHRIRYNATRVDISNVKLQYRAVIEELLYAAGIKK
jgi:hypothetical protein